MSTVGVKHIDHVTVVVNNLQRSREFYVDLLGMQEVPRPAFSFAGSWFQAGETQIHLIEEHDQTDTACSPVASSSTRNHHFAFLVDDAHQAAERFKDAGVPLVSAPKPRPDGAVQVFVHDPDGHLIECCSLS